jgi:hypothetical protein
MPWYWKVGLPVVFALAAAAATAASVRGGERALGLAVMLWILSALAAACAMGALSHYYHLQEQMEGVDSEGETLTNVRCKGDLQA